MTSYVYKVKNLLLLELRHKIFLKLASYITLVENKINSFPSTFYSLIYVINNKNQLVGHLKAFMG